MTGNDPDLLSLQNCIYDILLENGGSMDLVTLIEIFKKKPQNWQLIVIARREGHQRVVELLDRLPMIDCERRYGIPTIVRAALYDPHYSMPHDLGQKGEEPKETSNSPSKRTSTGWDRRMNKDQNCRQDNSSSEKSIPNSGQVGSHPWFRNDTLAERRRPQLNITPPKTTNTSSSLRRPITFVREQSQNDLYISFVPFENRHNHLKTRESLSTLDHPKQESDLEVSSTKTTPPDEPKMSTEASPERVKSASNPDNKNVNKTDLFGWQQISHMVQKMTDFQKKSEQYYSDNVSQIEAKMTSIQERLDKLSEVENLLRQKESKITHLNNELKDTEETYRTAIGEMKIILNQKESEISQLHSQLKEHEQEALQRSYLLKSIATYKTKLEEKENELKDKEKIIKTLDSVILAKDVTNLNQVEDLEKKLESMKQDLVNKDAIIAKHENSLKESASRLKKQEAKFHVLEIIANEKERKLSLKEARISEIEKKLALSEERVETLKSKHQQELAKTQKEYEEKVRKLEEKLEAEQKLLASKEQNDAQHQTVVQLEKKLSELEESMKSSKLNHAKEVQKLVKSLEKKYIEIEELNEHVSSTSTYANQVQVRYEKVEQDLEALKVDMATKDKKVEKLEAKIKNLKDQLKITMEITQRPDLPEDDDGNDRYTPPIKKHRKSKFVP